MTLSTVGVHHITLIGSNRRATIDFYQGVLGMPLIFEQPNLDTPEETHLYFDAGDGRLITFFVREERSPDPAILPELIGTVHHIAYAVSREVFERAEQFLKGRGHTVIGPLDRGFMDSLYFFDPNGLRLELATYKFEPPPGHSVSDVLSLAHRLRVAQNESAIGPSHLEAAIAQLRAEKAGSVSPSV